MSIFLSFHTLLRNGSLEYKNQSFIPDRSATSSPDQFENGSKSRLILKERAFNVHFNFAFGAIMKLVYRGVRYEHEPATLAVCEGEVGGKYRGQIWQRHILTEAPAPQPVRHLVYRGVPYTMGTIEPAVARPAAEPTMVPSLAAVTRNLASGSVLSNIKSQVSRLHRSNLQHNIEHRMEVAKEQGNMTLLAMLEREFQEIMS
jgi:hypothetical protein